MLLLAPAAAQTPAPASAQQPSPARENPGLINEIGKLLKNSSSLLPGVGGADRGRGPPDTAPPPPVDLAPAASVPPIDRQPPPSPADARSPPMVPAMVTGRQLCPPTPGGGSDCKAAADALCKAGGYSGGRSLGVDSTERCSAKVMIPGRPREPGDCRTENFVSRAWCQ